MEDLPDAQDWLRDVLSEAYTEIETSIASTIEESQKALRLLSPDIALIDLSLPDGNGVSIIELLADKHPRCHIVVTSIYDDDDHVFSALAAGAHGYLLKESSKAELISSLADIVDGKPVLSSSIARKLISHFSVKTQRSKAPQLDEAQEVNSLVHLSDREEQVLALIGRGFKNHEVAAQLELKINTISGYIKTIYSKLNISNRAQASVEAARRGLLGGR